MASRTKPIPKHIAKGYKGLAEYNVVRWKCRGSRRLASRKVVPCREVTANKGRLCNACLGGTL